jgi:zeta-carotene desaturase
LKVFLDGLLNHRESFHMGVPTVPLEKLYTEPCLKLIARRGDQVRLRCSAARIEVEGSRVQRVLLNDGTWLTGDYYLSSLPPQDLLKLLPADVIESLDYFKRLGWFESSPITSVYLWYDRHVTTLENAVLLGREIQWFFNKTPRSPDGNRPNGQHLGLVVSASRKLLRMSRSEILDIALRDLEAVLPSTRQARLMRTVVMKEPFATFSCRAGCDIFRVDQKSPLENFFVAGDWTRTGWPPTMEGAVRSSYRCAELILEAEGTPRKLLQPDLPTQSLPRWVASLCKLLRPGAF